MLVLAELTPLDTVAGTRKTLRAASSDDKAITGLNSVRWWPAIAETPVLTMKLFDGDFTSDVSVGGASLEVLIDKLAKLEIDARRFRWAGAGVKIWAGNSGDAWPWTQRFDGKVEGFDAKANRVALKCKVNTEPFEKSALTLTYAGTGAAEGDANLKNKVKPWVFGRAANVEPVLINAVDNVYQFSSYGPIEAVTVLYERGSAFPARDADFASYAALVAATILPGHWATCIAEGMVRLGAPAYGVITGDVDGDKPGGVWLRKTGEIINRIAVNAGISAGLLDAASLTALDAAITAAYPNDGTAGVVLDEQATVLDVARRLARACNAQAGVSWLGKLFICRVAIGTPVITLDAQGRRVPGIISSAESDVSPPYWRIEAGAQRAWRVHSYDEIASSTRLIPMGLYAAATVYREGNIVELADGSQWKYKDGVTAGAGNAPPTSGTSNTWWEQTRPPMTGPDIGVAAGAGTVATFIAIGTVAQFAGNGMKSTAGNTTSPYANFIRTASWAGNISVRITGPGTDKKVAIALSTVAGTTTDANSNAWLEWDGVAGTWAFKAGGSPVTNGSLAGSGSTMEITYDGVNFTAYIASVKRGETAAGSSTLVLFPKWVPFTADKEYSAMSVQYFTSNHYDSIGGTTKPENNADVTAIVDGLTDIIIKADATGAPKSGELTRNETYQLIRNGLVIVTGLVWTYTVESGTINGFTNASGAQSISGTGSVNFPTSSLGTDEATFTIKVVQGGTFTRSKLVRVAKQNDVPSTSGTGAGGTAQTDSLLASINSDSWAVVSDELNVTVATGATSATVTADLKPRAAAASPAGTWNIQGQAQWWNAGTSTWDDLGSATDSNPDTYTEQDAETLAYLSQGGALSFTIAKTGLTGGSAHKFRVKAKHTTAAATKVINLNGSASAQG